MCVHIYWVFKYGINNLWATVIFLSAWNLLPVQKYPYIEGILLKTFALPQLTISQLVIVYNQSLQNVHNKTHLFNKHIHLHQLLCVVVMQRHPETWLTFPLINNGLTGLYVIKLGFALRIRRTWGALRSVASSPSPLLLSASVSFDHFLVLANGN